MPLDWVEREGKWFAPVRAFTCPFHPYGPPDVVEVPDSVRELVAALAEGSFVEGLEDVPELLAAAKVELGLCCEGHEWRKTGELREVGAFELFVTELIDTRTAAYRSVILEEIARIGRFDGDDVRIPIIRSDT